MKLRAAKLVSRSRTERLVYRKPDPRLPEIGARLALTRRALHLTRFQMARLLGTDTSTWGTYEAGLERIPPDQALKLSAYGIPLDWVYDGKMGNLHPHIRTKIREFVT
jgi:transcriptional regulator with XRE-family HTH domain